MVIPEGTRSGGDWCVACDPKREVINVSEEKQGPYSAGMNTRVKARGDHETGRWMATNTDIRRDVVGYQSQEEPEHMVILSVGHPSSPSNLINCLA